MNSSAGATPAPIAYSPSAWSIVLLVLGVVTIVTSTFFHFTIISNGASGQTFVDMLSKASWWGALTGSIIVVLALLWYSRIGDNKPNFVWLFVLAFVAYLLSNMAIMFSLFQVEISPV